MNEMDKDKKEEELMSEKEDGAKAEEDPKLEPPTD